MNQSRSTVGLESMDWAGFNQSNLAGSFNHHRTQSSQLREGRGAARPRHCSRGMAEDEQQPIKVSHTPFTPSQGGRHVTIDSIRSLHHAHIHQVTRLSDAWGGDGWRAGAANDYGERPTIDFAYAGPFRCVGSMNGRSTAWFCRRQTIHTYHRPPA